MYQDRGDRPQAIQWDYHTSARFDRIAVYFPWLNRTLDSVILYRRVHSICFISNRDGRQMGKKKEKDG